MPPKKRPTTPKEPAAKRVATEDESPVVPSSSAPVPRTLLIVVTYPDDTYVHKVVEKPGWFPVDFETVWQCKNRFLPGHGTQSEWLPLIRVLYGEEEGDEEQNALFRVKDMAERKRILSDAAECEKFFALHDDKLEYFDVASLPKHPYNEPLYGPVRLILIHFF